ncbi:MAG: ATP-binding protein, partial [Candidatus Eisenbacteria bacterium]|nr:ATP-binding protein [Candidatus Eisenbacteria bacterium]
LLTEASRKRALGRFDEPIDIGSNDEVGELARSFETMCSYLAASREEVERTNQRLEAKVRERTEELRQKNLALEMQNERVIEASRLKSEFLASVSHELRTPLNAILALSELLEDGMCGELSLEQKTHIAMIHRSGGGLLRLINDILDLSKIEAGKLEFRFAACDIGANLARRAREMAPLAAERGIELRLAIAPGPRVLVDSGRICQILLNLLGNAIKFTEMGYVEVSSRVDRQAHQLRVAVRDTGIGIPPEHLEAIFQQFRQVDDSPSRRFGGTGLGLTISRRLAEKMGGTIEVESGVGRGSTFTLTLPAVPADDDEDDESGEAPSMAA